METQVCRFVLNNDYLYFSMISIKNKHLLVKLSISYMYSYFQMMGGDYKIHLDFLRGTFCCLIKND